MSFYRTSTMGTQQVVIKAIKESLIEESKTNLQNIEINHQSFAPNGFPISEDASPFVKSD